jgi:hypothetical protein
MAFSTSLLGISGGSTSNRKVINHQQSNQFISDANKNRKFEHFSHVSSQEYFAQILTLQDIDWLRLPLLQGLATSAISGAEGLVRASRSALTQFLNSQAQHRRQKILMVFLQDLSTVLGDNLQDDRFAIPAVEFVAFLIDSYIPVIPEASDPRFVNSCLLLLLYVHHPLTSSFSLVSENCSR